MKKIIVICSIAATLLLIIAAFPSAAETQIIKSKNENKFLNDPLKQKTGLTIEDAKEKISGAKWYPGFLIVQLIKGCVALILILLILLDIIEP